MGLVDNLIAQFQAQQDRANAANEQRFQQGLELFDRIIQQQETGDVSEQAIEAAIGRGRVKSVAQGTQALVSSGLSGTTTAAGLGKKFEEEVGVPARLQAADIRQQRLNQALRDKAGFIERREDIGPSYSDIAGLSRSIGAGQQARQIPVSSGGGGGDGGRAYRREALLSRRATAREAELNRQFIADQQRKQMQAARNIKTGYTGRSSGRGVTFAPTKPSVTASSLMQQADPYGISGYF